MRLFRLNEAILLANQNLEALHQARVALRRLRSAITLLKPILRDTRADHLAQRLKTNHTID
ncbi:CHAD domain-containing protein [Rhizobium brockwellii]|uniref:CHAD domain-containing protein n=1 Tax=Rhizobium brockwellii TaxID=3019932 RepID=UPI00387358FA